MERCSLDPQINNTQIIPLDSIYSSRSTDANAVPLQNEQRIEETREDSVIEFDWMLTDECNFNCDYCHPNIAVHKNEPPKHGRTSDQIADAFLGIGRRFHLTMSGGEPLLFPNFSEFCKKITDSGNLISMNTNLSIRDEVKKFSEIVDPTKVGTINAALHKMERDRQDLGIDDFAEDVVLLQKKGFNIQVFYVLYPPLLDSFEEDASRLKQLGVTKVAGKIFKGAYQGLIYPMAYSTEDRIKILGYQNSSYPVTLDYLDNKQYAFKAELCTSGINFFKVNVNGNVQRCPANAEKFGNIYDGTFQPGSEAKPCITTRVMSVSQCNRFSLR
jgi:MoaA/NifB/PqqE/SkfB family radical SAM enzyme